MGQQYRPLAQVYLPLLFLAIVSSLFLSLGWESLRRLREKKVIPLVLQESRRFSVDPYLVLAIASVESDFWPNTVGGKGEIGLMQLMPYNVRRGARVLRLHLGRNLERAFLPRLNIRLGAWYISQLRPPPKGISLELKIAYLAAEYNSGWKNVRRWIQRAREKGISFLQAITYPTTKRYVQKVLYEYARYRAKRVFEKKVHKI